MIEHSACERLKAKALGCGGVVRQRVLSDDEIRALWRACERAGPFGLLCQFMLATATRRNEAAFARWSEVKGNVWTIPRERFKSDSTHIVPLTQLALDIINALPRKGERVFRFNNFSKAKRRLDKLMGDVAPWRLHDLRRTARTRLSALTTYEVAELILGHSKRGLARVYDQHKYVDEMREALDAWSKRLQEIVGVSIETRRYRSPSTHRRRTSNSQPQQSQSN